MTLDPTLLFGLIAAAMLVVAAAFVAPALWSGRAPRSGASRAALNVGVHRAALEEIERERNAGALSDAEYRRAREEIERRLVDDVAEPAPAPAPPRRHRALAAGVAVLLACGAFALYGWFGTPSALTQPEVSAAIAAQDPASHRQALIRHLEEQPNDARSRVLLARLDLSADRFAEAAQGYEKALAQSTKVAADPAVWCEFADALGMAQGGVLEGRPRELIERALAIDPNHPTALEMAGSAAYERRDYVAAARYWRALHTQLAPGTPAYAQLATAIERAEQKARVVLR